jgi:hypothetical protein
MVAVSRRRQDPLRCETFQWKVSRARRKLTPHGMLAAAGPDRFPAEARELGRAAWPPVSREQPLENRQRAPYVHGAGI